MLTFSAGPNPVITYYEVITIENKQLDKSRPMNIQKTPTESQLRYITRLAGLAGVKIDAGKIDSQNKASMIIVKLRSMTGQNGSSATSDLRDKRIAFAMATKLMFVKYMHFGINCTRSDRFWEDVAELYRQYQENQTAFIK